jgi:hypothetical protein
MILRVHIRLFRWVKTPFFTFQFGKISFGSQQPFGPSLNKMFLQIIFYSITWAPSLSDNVFGLFIDGGETQFSAQLIMEFSGFDFIIRRDPLNGIVDIFNATKGEKKWLGNKIISRCAYILSQGQKFISENKFY